MCLCALLGTEIERKYFFWPFLPTIKNETFNLIWLNFLEPLLSTFWAYVKLWCVRVPCRAQRWRRRKNFYWLLFSTFEKNNYFVLFFTFYYFLEENILFNYNLYVIFFLVPNCPFYYVGAKLSGAKLSVFIMLVSNCPGAKLSGAKSSGAKLSYHLLKALTIIYYRNKTAM